MNDTFIQGTLKYVTDYTGFSGDPELQEGNYIALKMAATDGATTTVELLGGHSDPVTLDEDMNIVIRIESINQRIKVVTTKGSDSFTKIYSLNDLVLEPASN